VALVLERAHTVWERDGPGAALASLKEAQVSESDPAAPLLELVRSFFGLETGDPAGVDAIREAADAARRLTTSSPQEAVVSFNAISLQVNVCGMFGQHDEAHELIDFGSEWLRTMGAIRSIVPLRIARLGILLHQGRLFDLLCEADEIEEEFELDPLVLPHVILMRAHSLSWLGRHDEALALCAAAEELPGTSTWFAALNLGEVRGHCLLATGRVEQSADLYRHVFEQALRYGVGEPCSPAFAAGAVESAVAAGRLEEVDQLACWLEQHMEPLPCAWPRMVALGARAGCAAGAGDRDGADALYQEALGIVNPHLLDRAQLALRYGAWLRSCREVQRARPVLAGVVRTAEAQGAAGLAATAHAELLAAGGRRRRPNNRLELSSQERRVAKLAATGVTNREIAEELHLSPRTVESHLSAVFRKLGVASRRELLAGKVTLDA
jgi:DNA-binding CsgD family transcriptional regulator